MESNENFFISGTTLVQYTGPGGDVVVPEGVEDIAEGAFQYREDVMKVTLPSTVRRLGYEAFGWCSSLQEINLPEGLTQMQVYAFEGCINLREITLPESLTFLGAGAFVECDALRSLTLPAGLTFIGDDAWDRGLPVFATKGTYAYEWALKHRDRVKDVSEKTDTIEERPHKWWVDEDPPAGE